MPAVRSGLCSAADPETLLRGWQRSRDRGVAMTAAHSWVARLRPTGHHGVLCTPHVAEEVPACREQHGRFPDGDRRQHEPAFPGGSRPLCGHHPGTSPLPLVFWSQVLPSTPTPPLKPSCPHPRARPRLRASCRVPGPMKKLSLRKALTAFPGSRVRVEAQLRTRFQALCVRCVRPQLSQSTPILICF